MAERIYTRAERGRLEPLEEKPFSTEDELQALIVEHPELLVCDVHVMLLFTDVALCLLGAGEPARRK